MSRQEGDTALCWAVENNDIEMVKLLIEKGAWRTIDTYTAEEGRSALGIAAHRLNIEIVKILREAGADPQAIDFDRHTAYECLPTRTDENKEKWDNIFSLLSHNYIQKKIE